VYPALYVTTPRCHVQGIKSDIGTNINRNPMMISISIIERKFAPNDQFWDDVRAIETVD